MTAVRWKLIDRLQIETGMLVTHSYGYQTKNNRIAMKLSKSHANDAYCMDKVKRRRLSDLYTYKQTRRNNRSLEKFYDAKLIDSRTGNKVSGQDLFSGRTTRDITQNSENLHIFRQAKDKKGYRSIRKQRYPFQPRDIVRYKTNLYKVKSTHNKGTRVILQTGKSVRCNELKTISYGKGLVAT